MMFRSACLVLLSLVLLSCGNGSTDEEIIDPGVINNTLTGGEAGDDQYPEITFNEQVFNFGEVEEGTQVSHSFVFENTGNEPLLIFGVDPECGCTVTDDWPKQPIKPGNEAEVTITFNSTGKVGTVNKRLTIRANTSPANNVVAIRGVVKSKE